MDDIIAVSTLLILQFSSVCGRRWANAVTLMARSLLYKILGSYMVTDGLPSSSTSVPYLSIVRRKSFERVSQPDPVIFISCYARVRANVICKHSDWKEARDQTNRSLESLVNL